MVWSPKAQLAFANDLVTASLVLDDGSDTRVAIQGIADLLISAAIAADPTLAANVTAAAEAAVDGALSGADISLRSDPGVIRPAIDDENNLLVFDAPNGQRMLAILANGSTFVRLSTLAQDEDGALLYERLVKAGVASTLEIASDDQYLFGGQFANGQLYENVVERDTGQRPDWVLARDKFRQRFLSEDPALTKTIKADGTGDFTTLQDALAAATADPGNWYRLHFYSGGYGESALLGAAGSMTPPKNVIELLFKEPGTTALTRTQPDSATNDQIALADMLLLFWSIDVTGMRAFGGNIRYLTHLDAGGINPNIVQRFTDCFWYHSGISAPLGTGVAKQWVGIGASSGSLYLFDRCTVVSDEVIHFMHNRENFTKPARVITTDSTFAITSTTQTPKIPIQSLGSGTPDEFILKDSVLPPNTVIVATDSPWIGGAKAERNIADHYEIRVTIENCGPVAYDSQLRGKALQVTSATTGTASKVRFAGTAAAAIIGPAQLFDGGVGLAGYASGNLDISGIAVGENGAITTATNTLARRLGDCSTVSKTLTVTIDGASVDVVFNENYLAPEQSNATIIGKINAVLGAAGTASEFLIADAIHYPHVIGCQDLKVNAGTTGIPRGSSVAYTGHGVRLMTPADPTSIFAGVAVQRIPVGAVGRFITDGYFSTAQLTGAPALTAGTPVYHSDTTPGGFSLAGSRLAGTPIYNGWVPIKGSK